MWTGRQRSIALLLAIILVISSSSCGLFNDTYTVNGSVVDSSSGVPISGATVICTPEGGEATRSDIHSSTDGSFRLIDIPSATYITIQADGYETQAIKSPPADVKVRLRPTTVDVSVVDAQTNQPLAAMVESIGATVAETGPGAYQLSRVRNGSVIRVTLPGYEVIETPFSGQRSLALTLRRTTLSGSVVHATTGEPLSGITLYAGTTSATTGEDGTYRIEGIPADATVVQVTAPGFHTYTADIVGRPTLDIALQPLVAKAPYVTFYAVGEPSLMGNVRNMLDTTELNAVVIDIKGDRGWIAYQSDVPLAQAIGANEVNTIPDIDSLMADLKEAGIYTIARIVTFKDDPLARNGPDAGVDVAIIDSATGKPWVDGEGLAWVDPFRPEVWDYNIALAKEAASKGFDEIQFDYIRFPTDPSASTSVDRTSYSQPNTETNRLEAVAGFLERAQAELKPLGVNISVDVFGYTCWRDDDMGIGQKLEVIGEYADFVCPMVYPSTYSSGIPDYADAVGHPYEIVYYSVKNAVDRLKGLPAKVRPWLQYFDDYPWESGRPYNAAEITAQIRASDDAGAVGWQLWDPFVKYARGGLAPE